MSTHTITILDARKAPLGTQVAAAAAAAAAAEIVIVTHSITHTRTMKEHKRLRIHSP